MNISTITKKYASAQYLVFTIKLFLPTAYFSKAAPSKGILRK